MNKQCLSGALFSLSLFAANASASYHWIDADDIFIRADIQLLADVGVVTVPTTTYPLMWSGVMEGINRANVATLSPDAQDAYHRVRHRFNQYKKNKSTTKVSMAGANDSARFQHYGSPVREKGETTMSHMGGAGRFAYNIQASYAYDAQDDEDVRIDGSYLSMGIGNWIVSAGSYGEWYGQGWDTTLIKSTNARPMQQISLTRNNPEAFTVPVLQWLGPWTLTTGVSWMNDDDYRAVENTLLWSFRTSFKPHPNFEFGISRTAQICGQGKGCGVGTWWDMFTGDTNDYETENPANQLAAVDMRWGATYNGIPYGIYWESMGEDSMRLDTFPPFQAKSDLFGADISYRLYNHMIRTFIEYTETNAKCSGFHGNCTYEHSTYRGGYRYNGNSIGSTYDNDAKTYTIGFIGHTPIGHRWKSNFRYLDLNVDNTNAPSPGGNPVAPIAEKATQVDFSYIWPLFKGQMEAGASYTHSTYEDDISNDNNFDIWGKWSYVF
ncbi:capsule assembly Wzi family protein [Psychromonas sp. MME2]|uniref:capsule assembly Wzi family protein n=1 Tax=unclassified Psychromonas TaxID=2614957 RepID=UPI00339D05C6